MGISNYNAMSNHLYLLHKYLRNRSIRNKKSDPTQKILHYCHFYSNPILATSHIYFIRLHGDAEKSHPFL